MLTLRRSAMPAVPPAPDIRSVRGDLLQAKTESMVNPVNTVGVMGAGLAKQFRREFPGNYAAYVNACRAGEVATGRMFVFDNGPGCVPRWIINFPTKRHWKERSRVEDIALGLDDLRSTVQRLRISSIAVPALGCGLGGLDWAEVKPLVVASLSGLDATTLVFEPN